VLPKFVPAYAPGISAMLLKPETMSSPALHCRLFAASVALQKNIVTAMTDLECRVKTQHLKRRKTGNTSALMHSVSKSYSNLGFRQLLYKKLCAQLHRVWGKLRACSNNFRPF
jgi:hypothetical protein